MICHKTTGLSLWLQNSLLCAMMSSTFNIHPHAKSSVGEMKKVTGEIDPEPLPKPQRQSSSFASSFNIVEDGLDASSTNPMAKTRRRRDAEEANVDPRTPNPPVYILPHDGVYLLVVYVGDTSNTQTFTANVHVEVCMSFIVF